MNKKDRLNLWYFVIAFFVILLIQSWWVTRSQIETIPYSEFLDQLTAENIERVAISENLIQGKFKKPLKDKGPVLFETTRVDPNIASLLEQHGVTFDGKVESKLLADLLSWILPLLIIFAVWYFMFRGIAAKQGLGGLMQVGKSKARVYMERDTGTRFEDVAGVDEAKDELAEIVAFLKDKEKYGRLGARQPKGVLLVGPPGTGKTLLARAVAGEAEVPFYSISGAEFVEMFVGVGAARVRDLFEQARTHAPCIIFIDELDALGRARGSYGAAGGGHDEKEQTLNQLLAEMDGFDSREGIVILAATNQPEVLDPALLRAGRFDRQVLVDRPDKRGRLAILKVHVKKIVVADDLDLSQVAAITPGFSGADLANLINEAAIIATRRSAKSVELADFTAAVERIVAGLEKRNRILSEKERDVVAHHEMGHAIVASLLPGVDPVHKVSIVPRGIGALGYTMQRPTEDRYLMSRTELENKMAVLFGGRAAEHVIYGEVTTGAQDDIAKATDIARTMVTQYGMNERLGQVAYEERRQIFLGGDMGTRKSYGEETAREIDIAVRDALDGAFTRASRVLNANRAILEKAAHALLEEETLDSDALSRLIKGATLPPDADTPRPKPAPAAA